MAIDNSITFGGINSADFGIYISGEGVFNAPQRDVEMISVPGRNGAIALDHGRFQNIEVTYPAFNYEADYDTFQQQLSDFRNAICAQKGYKRLSDTFHPDEYRMATYLSGLEVKPIKYNTASEFNIVFNCKPQRYLTSGEEEIDVTDWSDVKTLSGESVTFDDGNTSKGFQSIRTVFNPSQDGTPWKSEVESAPYLFRQSSGGTVDHEYDSESDAIVGGTVAWNQLQANSSSRSHNGITYTYADGSLTISGTATSDSFWLSGTATKWDFIKDHIYLFDVGNSSYEYMTNTVGFWYAGGGFSDSVIRTAQQIKKATSTANTYLQFAISNGGSISPAKVFKPQVIDLTALFGSTIADYIYGLGSTNGIAKLKEWGFDIDSYHAYETGSLESVNVSAHITRDANNNIIGNYSLDSTKEFRGIFKLDANNNLYADGDVYEPSGGVTRNFGIRAYQSGDESLADAITDGTNTVYKLSTPTTETADPFTAIQDVSPYGTEEYVDYGVSQGTRDIAVPVGHQTNYIQRVPIEGKTQMKTYVSPTSSVEDATEYTTNLNGAKYGGTLEVISGKLDKTHEDITYTGQTINEPWLSDCDEYQQGATPTYGATVVYELTTPTRVSLTGQNVAMLDGTNVIWADADSVEVKYGFEPGILYNPTRFDAQPELEVEGDGIIYIGDKRVEISNMDYGEVELISPEALASGYTSFDPTNFELLNTGDQIRVKAGTTFPVGIASDVGTLDYVSLIISDSSRMTAHFLDSVKGDNFHIYVPFVLDEDVVLYKGLSTDAYTYISVGIGYHVNGVGYNFNSTGYFRIKLTNSPRYGWGITINFLEDLNLPAGLVRYFPSARYVRKPIVGISTKSIVDTPMVIDCELGEAYTTDQYGRIILLNAYIDLGSDLPVLEPGLNEISYQNTITDLKVKPNWWKI